MSMAYHRVPRHGRGWTDDLQLFMLYPINGADNSGETKGKSE